MQKYIIPGLLIAAFTISFYSVLQKLAIRWESGDNSYCYLMIPLFIYLCWEKRKEFHFEQFSWNLWGVVPVLLAILLMVVGELGSMETLLYCGIWGGAVSVLFILYGVRLRQLVFPLLVLAFLVPIPPYINRMLTFNLKLAASTLSAKILRLAGASVLQDGNIIDLGITQMQVVDACSGLRYFVPLILMSLLFGHFYTKMFWQKALLIIVVLPLSIFVNSLRIFATGMLHLWGYPELAEDFFHDFSGWVTFMAAAAVLFGCSWVLKRFNTKSEKVPAMDSGGRLVPSFIPVATTLILCTLFTGGGYMLHALPSIANLPERKSFDAFPMRIGDWDARRNYLSKEILENLGADEYVHAVFQKKGKRNSIQLLIPFYEYQGTRHTAHAPQSCMLGGGWSMLSSRERVVQTSTGEDLALKTTIWEKGDTKILGGYFFYQRGRVIISPWMNKYWLMVGAFTKRRTDGALVRMELAMAPGQSTEEAYRLLEDFASQIYEVLPQYVPI